MTVTVVLHNFHRPAKERDERVRVGSCARVTAE
jgi:hypothetical protein